MNDKSPKTSCTAKTAKKQNSRARGTTGKKIEQILATVIVLMFKQNQFDSKAGTTARAN